MYANEIMLIQMLWGIAGWKVPGPGHQVSHKTYVFPLFFKF